MTDQRKLDFAAALLRCQDDAFKAAFSLFEPGEALQIAKIWERDPIVLAEKDRLLASNTSGKAFLPTKEQQARDIWLLASDPQKCPEDRLKAHRLYAEIMGNIEKPVAGGVNIMTQGVMIVRDAGTDDEWQQKALKQQRTLTADATIN